MEKEDDKKDILDKQIENFKYTTSLVKVIIGFIGLIIFTLSKHAFIFFSAAILPSIVVIFIDSAEHKCMSATICTFNLIGIIPFLKELYISESVQYASKDLITDPTAWMIVYGTTFIGLIIYVTLPSIIAQIYIAKANMRITKLMNQKKKICNEWDIKFEEKKEEESLEKVK